MTTLDHITLSELEHLLKTAGLPADSRFTVMFEDAQVAASFEKRKKAMCALQRLRGSGNDNLVHTLLQDRARDML